MNAWDDLKERIVAVRAPSLCGSAWLIPAVLMDELHALSIRNQTVFSAPPTRSVKNWQRLDGEIYFDLVSE